MASTSFHGLDPKEAGFADWAAVAQACSDAGWALWTGSRDWAFLPAVDAASGTIWQINSLMGKDLSHALHRIGVDLGMRPVAFGLWSFRKYAATNIAHSFDFAAATRALQHAMIGSETARNHYMPDLHDPGRHCLRRGGGAAGDDVQLWPCRYAGAGQLRQGAE